MTQIERTNAYLKTLEKGTILTKKEYEKAYYGLIKELRKKGEYENVYFSNWSKILQTPDRFNVERIEINHKVPTSKITTVDVLEMVKNGCTVEEIEKVIYTTITEIRIKIK